MSDWQEFKGAPKDGTWFIASSFKGKWAEYISWGRNRHGDLCWCSTNSWWPEATEDFTHWTLPPKENK